ncbi:MAG: ABC transporter permease [Lachnospiraceae bacterium]|nr:ABC transporter permease [Lachnospiraceae bacterium]
MLKFIELTKRNLRIYFRDWGAIFFSLLSMFIVILLMVFFLGDMSIENVTELLSYSPGRDAAMDQKNAELLIFAWTCAGILSINAVTVTLAAYSGMIKDRVSGRLNAIYTSSANQFTITASYVAAAWVASVLVCILTLAIVEGIGVWKGMEWFSLAEHLKLIAMIMVNSFTYATFMYLLSHIAKSEGAWSGIGTVIGTLVGFFGGIYIPIGGLAEGVGNVMKCTPVIYGSSMFRKIMTDTALENTLAGIPREVINEYRIMMGIDLKIGSTDVSVWAEWWILLGCGILFLVLGAVLLWKTKKTDR